MIRKTRNVYDMKVKILRKNWNVQNIEYIMQVLDKSENSQYKISGFNQCTERCMVNGNIVRLFNRTDRMTLNFDTCTRTIVPFIGELRVRVY